MRRMVIAYQSKGVNSKIFVVEKLVTDGACTFGGRLFTVVVSWLTIDGLCCGNRQ